MATEADAEWTLALRQVFQDVQLQALEVSAYHFRPDGKHQRTLVPSLRRLAKLFDEEVRDGKEVVEEQFVLFLDELWVAVARVIVTPKVSDIVIEAVASLVGEFLRKKSEKEAPCWAELRAGVLSRVTGATKAEDKSVRLHACQVLQILLDRLETIEQPLFGQLRTALLPRLNDKVTSIRIQSIHALKQLQDPANESDKVTKELQRLMISDPSKDVRKAALMSVEMKPAIYSDMLVRIRDANEDVRYVAFQALGNHIDLKDIPINDRAHLLDQGLQDRSTRVQRACEQMVLRKWLPSCDRSPVALLKALDIEQFPEIASKVAHLILKHFSEQSHSTKHKDDDQIVAQSFLKEDPKALDPERVFYWKEQCYYVQKVDRDADKAALLLPNISEFSKLLLATCEAGPDVQFVALQLLALGHYLDFQDEFGRRILLDALRKLLRQLETESQLITPIMELMAFIYSRNAEQEFLQVVAEILSDMYEPLEADSDSEMPSNSKLNEEEYESATRKFEELEKRLEKLEFESPEYIEVQNEMVELEKLLQDPQVLCWLRCLEIVAQLLKLTSVALNNPIVAGMGRYILPAIESDIPALRESGMECLGLYCLLDKRVTERHMIVFWRALNNDDEEREVKLNCIRAILDMAMTFKDLQIRYYVVSRPDEPTDDKIASDESQERDAEPTQLHEDELDLDTVFIGLARLVTVDDVDIQSTIIEGFARLFLLNRISNVAVLAILLETYFSPKLQDVQVRGEDGYQSRSLQLLSVFFPAFAAASTVNCTLLEEAAMHLVQKSMEKEDIESGSAIDLGACTKYVLQLLSHREDEDGASNSGKSAVKTENSKKKNHSCAHHNRIGINICVVIIALEKIGKATSTIPGELIVARQKLLMKMVVFAEISARERRSAALMVYLLQEITKTCFESQRGLLRSAEAFLKRASSSYKEQVQKMNEGSEQELGAALEQDQQWAQDLILERQEALSKALEDAAAYWRKQRQRQKKRRGPRRFVSSDSDDSSDSSGSSDDEEGSAESAAVPARRELSSRRSKTAAVSRMQQEGAVDARVKQAIKDADTVSDEDNDGEDDDDDDEEEEDEESDEESSAADDEEE